jgi:hypothetical protein
VSHLPSRAKGKALFRRIKQHPEKSEPLSHLISPEIYTTTMLATPNIKRFMQSEIPKKS